MKHKDKSKNLQAGDRGYTCVRYKYIGSRVAQRTGYAASGFDYNIVYQPSYDNLGRIRTAWTYQDDGGPTDVAKIQYQYDPNTNSITRQRFDQYTSPADPCNVYGYDRLRRLIQSDYGLDDTNEVFILDKLGNRENVNVRGGYDVDYDVGRIDMRSATRRATIMSRRSRQAGRPQLMTIPGGGNYFTLPCRKHTPATSGVSRRVCPDADRGCTLGL